MSTHRMPSGRAYETGCPFMSDCWANQGCWQGCPPTLRDVLEDTARLEHECDLTPHTDPDVQWACESCAEAGARGDEARGTHWCDHCGGESDHTTALHRGYL